MENLQNPGRPPKSWLVESILVTLFCCLPLGIAGIINASKVESRYYGGDTVGAQRASREARRWTLIGLGLAVAGAILYVILLVLGVAAGVNLPDAQQVV
jgi:hypothetical protein